MSITDTIWDTQARMMRASGQSLPDSPQLSSQALLYIALQLEELSELLMTTTGVLRERSSMSDDADQCVFLDRVERVMHEQGSRMLGASRDLRSAASAWNKSNMPPLFLNPAEAVALADDVTDCAVVVAGAALSLGLPGAECYTEVQRSNLSKCNPATGMIDKDSSGKWIKGAQYTPPDLESVLYPES